MKSYLSKPGHAQLPLGHLSNVEKGPLPKESGSFIYAIADVFEHAAEFPYRGYGFEEGLCKLLAYMAKKKIRRLNEQEGQSQEFIKQELRNDINILENTLSTCNQQMHQRCMQAVSSMQNEGSH